MVKIDNENSDFGQMEAWMDWKQICDLAKCDTSSQRILGALALTRFNKECRRISYVDTYNMVNQFIDRYEGEELEEESTGKKVKTVYEAFQRFESHAITTQHKTLNKSYKDYIFYQAINSDDPPLKVINGLVKSMMRDVVRTYLQKECGFRSRVDADGKKRLYQSNVSLNAQSDDGSSLENFLTDLIDMKPDEAAALDIIKQEAEKLAKRIEPELSHVERISCAADYLECVRSDKELLKIINMNSSSFGDISSRKIPKKVLNGINEQFELSDDIDIIIKNIDLFGDNKLPVKKQSQELWLMTGYVLKSLKKLAFYSIKKRKNSEKIYLDFLVYNKKG